MAKPFLIDASMFEQHIMARTASLFVLSLDFLQVFLLRHRVLVVSLRRSSGPALGGSSLVGLGLLCIAFWILSIVFAFTFIFWDRFFFITVLLTILLLGSILWSRLVRGRLGLLLLGWGRG